MSLQLFELLDFQGNIKEYDASHLDFGYRHSVFHDNHEVIGEVIMTLKPGDKMLSRLEW